MPCLQGVSEVAEIRNKTNMPVNIENRKNSWIYFWRVGTLGIDNDINHCRQQLTARKSRKAGRMSMTTITIKTVKRASGYQARYELPGSAQPLRNFGVRCVGHATREEAIEAAKARIKRTMDTRVPGMSSIQIEVARG